MNRAILNVLQYFAYQHLPESLQKVSKPFSDLATIIANREPDSPETTIALRKLLESKDAAVRASLPILIPVPNEPDKREDTGVVANEDCIAIQGG